MRRPRRSLLSELAPLFWLMALGAGLIWLGLNLPTATRPPATYTMTIPSSPSLASP